MALDLETREQLLTALRRFVSERLRPLEASVAENDAVPDDLVEEMKALGLFGLSIPESYGGLDLSMEDECLVAIEMGHASPAFRSTFGTNVGIGSQGLVMFGDDAQKQRWLPKIASGEIITSFALTEAEAGSDSGSVQTRAVREGDHYVLNGSKRYITNAGKAHLFTVMARTDQAVKGGNGVSAFLVPRDAPGVSVGKPEKKMGQQGAHIHDVIFDNVKVAVENRLGEEGQGFRVAMQVLDKGRLHISAVCIGVAERLITDSVAYAQERRQFGRAISEQQLIQAMIADSKTEALAARALTLETARKRDSGEGVTLEAAAAKLYASEMVGRVADRAVQIFGGAGYVADYGVERLYRDVRIFRIYEGTSEIQRLIVARETCVAAVEAQKTFQARGFLYDKHATPGRKAGRRRIQGAPEPPRSSGPALMTNILYPKATAVWMVENTSLTFEQIADFCGLHPLEVNGIADGEVARDIRGADPIANGQLTREDLDRAGADPTYRMRAQVSRHAELLRPVRKAPRYTPVSRRQDRPDAIAWFVRNHPEVTDAQISKLLGTTKSTIDQVRTRSHWNSPNIKPVDPVSLGLCGQLELDALVLKAAERKTKEDAKKGLVSEGPSLRPAAETGAVPVSASASDDDD